VDEIENVYRQEPSSNLTKATPQAYDRHCHVNRLEAREARPG
jgi:hypothetical protein